MQELHFSVMCFVIQKNTEDKLNWVCFYQFQFQVIKSSLWKVRVFSGFKIKWFRYTTWKLKCSPRFCYSGCSELGSVFCCRQVTRKVQRLKRVTFRQNFFSQQKSKTKVRVLIEGPNTNLIAFIPSMRQVCLRHQKLHTGSTLVPRDIRELDWERKKRV